MIATSVAVLAGVLVALIIVLEYLVIQAYRSHCAEFGHAWTRTANPHQELCETCGQTRIARLATHRDRW